jgi:TetR/AcrR family transcriptional repressor of mexJK operon
MELPVAPTGDRRSPAKHEAILGAATELFLREGYERASIEGVAAAAGVSKQTVYKHFGDKQRLFLSVMWRANEAAGVGTEGVAQLVQPTGDIRADLRAAGQRLLRAITAPEVLALHRLTIAEGAHHPELQQLWRDDEAKSAVIDTIAKFLAECHHREQLTVRNPALTARHFVLLLSMEGHSRTLRGLQSVSEAELDVIAEEVTDLILRASTPTADS